MFSVCSPYGCVSCRCKCGRGSNSRRHPTGPPGYWGWHARTDTRLKLGTHSPPECPADEENRIGAGCPAPKPSDSCPSGPLLYRAERRFWPCISWGSQRRSRSNSCLKPYWERPAGRNSRGGAGNIELTGASPKCLMDIGYPACKSAVRLFSTR